MVHRDQTTCDTLEHLLQGRGVKPGPALVYVGIGSSSSVIAAQVPADVHSHHVRVAADPNAAVASRGVRGGSRTHETPQSGGAHPVQRRGQCHV